MWSSNTVKYFYKRGFGKALFLVAGIAVLGLDSNSFASDQLEQAHRARLVAAGYNTKSEELSDSLHLSISSLRNIDLVGKFVAQYAARSLKGRWKAESRRVAGAIVDYGTRHGIDPLLLLAVIENESRFDPEVVGAHGEIGLMQIKPATAEWIAKKNSLDWSGADTLRDPVANIRIGAAYLSMLREKYAEDKDLYLAAYNMGVKHLNKVLSGNMRPQIYPQRTNLHYSRIYFEFLGKKHERAQATTSSSFAGV